MPNNDQKMALVLSRVSAHFGDEDDKNISVLENVSFSIPTGNFVSIIGPSVSRL